MSFALKLLFLLLSLGAFGAYTASGPDAGAPQTLDDGNPPPPKP